MGAIQGTAVSDPGVVAVGQGPELKLGLKAARREECGALELWLRGLWKRIPFRARLCGV